MKKDIVELPDIRSKRPPAPHRNYGAVSMIGYGVNNEYKPVERTARRERPITFSAGGEAMNMTGDREYLERVEGILDKLSEGWSSAIDDMEAFGISDQVSGALTLHVRRDWFLEHFAEYEVGGLNGKYRELYTILRGIKIFCLESRRGKP